MNETPNESLQKSTALFPGFRLWLKLLAATFLVTSLLASMLTGRPHGWSQWWQALIMISVISFLAGTMLSVLWLLIRWLRWRRVLFLLASLVTAIALFYAEEDWRGHHAWEQFKRAEEAKGEHFDWASVVPPPVPDDQNFALTPVVASSYGQVLDRTGREIQPRNDKLVNRLWMPFYTDSGPHSADITTNGLSNWTLGKRTDLTAFQRYYRAMAVDTNQFPVPPQPQTPAADVLLAWSRYDATIEELRQAALLPYSRFPLEYDKVGSGNISLPYLPFLNSGAKLLCLRATAELQTGGSDQSLADLQLVQRLTDSIRPQPLIVSHLIRIVMVQYMLQPVWEGLADHRWSELQLAGLDAGLAKLDFLTDYKQSLRAYRAYMTVMIDYLRRHPGEYNRLSNYNFPNSSVHSGSEFITSLLMRGHLVPSGWFDQNQVRCDRTLDEFYLTVADDKTHTVTPALVRQGDGLVEAELQRPGPFNLMEFNVLQRMGKTARSFAWAQCSVDQARVAIGLERYRLAQGWYPDALAALAPKYLEQVPNDVIGGRPLHYRLTEDGQFVLYSVGWNETDDGGVVALTPGSTPQQDPSQGDWVWRYPQK